MPPLDEAKRAQLQAILDEETSKSALAKKVRRAPIPPRSIVLVLRLDFFISPSTTNSDSRASPTATQVRAAAKTPAKTRTLVRATNDKNMFISGHKPAPKRLVSSSAGRRSTPKAPRPPRPANR